MSVGMMMSASRKYFYSVSDFCVTYEFDAPFSEMYFYISEVLAHLREVQRNREDKCKRATGALDSSPQNP